MSFALRLRAYMEELGCSSSELAEASGVSRSNISRYLSGRRAPSAGGDTPVKLVGGLATMAAAKGLSFDEHAAVDAFMAELTPAQEYALLPERLDLLLNAFDVARNRLARALDFDPSYISRILVGQRRPGDLASFAEGVASYIARNYSNPAGVAIAADLTGWDAKDLESPNKMAAAIKAFLGTDGGASAKRDDVSSFLERLDDFDLGSFLQEARFDELKVPTVPFQLPTTKTYAGIEEMKQAELDFLKAAALSKSTADVILYSDMPLGEMAADGEFPKKVMLGMAALIRKGVRLQNIHDVHRPMGELLMGLEGWIPVYMTGQIAPYYLPQPTNSTFLHFIRSAGTVAVTGEAIAGNQGGGRYVVTKNASDVAYVRRRAQELLAHAKPLLRVFAEEDSEKLRAALARLERAAGTEPVKVGEGTFANIAITVWPKSHAVIEKDGRPKMTFVVEYPALVDALERYEPTLF